MGLPALAAAFLFLLEPAPARAAMGSGQVDPVKAPIVAAAMHEVSAGGVSDLTSTFVVAPDYLAPSLTLLSAAEGAIAAPAHAESSVSALIVADEPVVAIRPVETGPARPKKKLYVRVSIEQVDPGRPAPEGAEGPEPETAGLEEQPPVRGQLARSAASLGSDARDAAPALVRLFEDAGGRPVADHARLVVGGGRADGFTPLRANEISLNPDPAAKPHVLGVIERAPFADGAFETVLYRGGVDVTPRGLSEASRLLPLGGRLVFDTGPAESVRIRYLIPALLRASFAPNAVMLDMRRPHLLLEALKIADAASVEEGGFTFPDLFQELALSDLRLRRMIPAILALSPELEPNFSLYLAVMLTSGVANWTLTVTPELERSIRAVLASPRVRRAAPRQDRWAPPRLLTAG